MVGEFVGTYTAFLFDYDNPWGFQLVMGVPLRYLDG